MKQHIGSNWADFLQSCEKLTDLLDIGPAASFTQVCARLSEQKEKTERI
jgi:hypothetical protein